MGLWSALFYRGKMRCARCKKQIKSVNYSIINNRPYGPTCYIKMLREMPKVNRRIEKWKLRLKS